MAEMNRANSSIKSLEKCGKGLEKEIHNLKRTLDCTRDTLKNVMSDYSSLKICKAKLQNEKRKLEKIVNRKRFKTAKTNKKDVDINKNYLKRADSAASSPAPLYTSMIAHWNPLPVEFFMTDSITMVTHTIENLPPQNLSLWAAAKELQEMMDNMCETFENMMEKLDKR